MWRNSHARAAEDRNEACGELPCCGYSLRRIGAMLAFVFTRLSSAAEVSAPVEESAFPGTLKSFLGIGRSGHVVAKLARLFALDSFAGGFVVQSFAAYWFYLRFGADPGTLGVIFFSTDRAEEPGGG